MKSRRNFSFSDLQCLPQCRKGTEFIWGSTVLSGLPKVFFSSCFSNPSTPRLNDTHTMTQTQWQEYGEGQIHNKVWSTMWNWKKDWFSCFKRGSETEIKLELLFQVFVLLVTCRKAQRASIVRKIFRPEITSINFCYPSWSCMSSLPQFLLWSRLLL